MMRIGDNIHFQPFDENFIKTMIESHTTNTKVKKVQYGENYHIQIFIENEFDLKVLESIRHNFFPAGFYIEFLKVKD